MSRLDFQEITARARGRWAQILPLVGPFEEVVAAEGRRHVGCPMHEGKTEKNFRLLRDFDDSGGVACNTCGVFSTGFRLIARYNRSSIREAFAVVQSILDGNTITPKARPRSDIDRQRKRKREEDYDAYVTRQLQEMYTGSVVADHPAASPLRSYLENRGIPMQRIPSALRFHPALPYYDRLRDANGRRKTVLLGKFPAILAVVTNLEPRVVAYHRIYLTADGRKADVPEPKRLTPRRNFVPISGAAIQLCPAKQSILALTEGFETGVAIMRAQRIPTWATISAQMLTSVQIPAHVKHVAIYADLDRSTTGQRRAQELGERLVQEGRTCTFFLPPGPIPADAKGVDWLDVSNQHGMGAIPPPLLPESQTATSTVSVISPRLSQAG